jgi:hypothetical protein
MPAAAMSAQQVRALLNGSASNDPEVQEQLNTAFAAMTRPQLYDIMREMKGLIAQVWGWGPGGGGGGALEGPV